jgi:hypothetical protein
MTSVSAAYDVRRSETLPENALGKIAKPVLRARLKDA